MALFDMPSEAQKLIFFDLETGGPDPKRHAIIQIGAVVLDEKLEIVDEFECKLQFDHKRTTAYALRKNHYQAGVWATEGRTPREAAFDFAEFLERHATSPHRTANGQLRKLAVLAAHNAQFDSSFLIEWFEKERVFLPAKRLVLCTMQLAMWHFLSEGRQPPNYQLATLCERFVVPFQASKAHDALGDATATAHLFRAMVRQSQGLPVAA